MAFHRWNRHARSGQLPLRSIIFISTSIFVSITLGFIAGGYFMQSHTKVADASMIKDTANPPTGFLQNLKHTVAATLLDVFGMGQSGDQEIGQGTVGEERGTVNTDAVLAAAGVENTTPQENEQVVVPRAPIEKAVQTKEKPPKKNSSKMVYAQEPCAFQEQSAPSVSAVVINEIAWMGAPLRAGQTVAAASGNEWIELKNKTDEEVDISGWQLRSKEGKLHIIVPDATTLDAGGFALFERGDDDAVPEVTADVIYSGTLGNIGAHLQLVTNSCEVVDEVDASSGWQEGDAKTKQTMERNEGGWRTSRYVGGTPKRANSSGIILVVAKNGMVKTATTKVIVTTGGGSVGSSGQGGGGGGGAGVVEPIVYPKLLISEIQLASASSSKDEFIELYNPNTQAVDLTDWYVQKKTKTASDFSTFAPKDLFAGRSIPAGGFIVIAHSSSSIAATVISDYGISPDNTFVIKNPNGEIVDTLGLGEAITCEGICAPNPADDESIHRKKAVDASGFQDTQNNKDDFDISTCPSPNSDIVCLPSGEIIIIVPPQATSTATSTPSGNGTSTIIIATSTPTTATTTATSTASSTPVIAPPVVISRIQITGAVAHATQNDSVEFCNNDGAVSADISGWKLRKRTKSGSEDSIKVVPSGTMLAPLACLTWANSADNFATTVGAGLASTATIAGDTSVAIIDTSGTVQDAVAWGSGHANPFIEGVAFSQNPETPGQFLKRKMLGSNFQDTNDNSADFELIEPTVPPIDPANSATTTATST